MDFYDILFAKKLGGGGSTPEPEPTPTDGNTHIYIEIPEGTPAANMTFYVRFGSTGGENTTIDWGDGVTEKNSRAAAYNYPHTYSKPGKYEITLTVNNGGIYFAGTSSNAIYGSTSLAYNRSRIKRLVIGNGVTRLGDYALFWCSSLEDVIISGGIQSIGESAFEECNLIKKVVIPNGVTSIGMRAFANCKALKNVVIPAGVTTLGGYMFMNCDLLQAIPENIISIGDYMFNTCISLERAIIPSSVERIGSCAFQSCYGICAYYVMATTPPTAGSTPFIGIRSDCVIYVPAESVEAYKAATNWSTYADKIQAMPA